MFNQWPTRYNELEVDWAVEDYMVKFLDEDQGEWGGAKSPKV